MTETQLRFLRAIGERVPLDRLVEVHLFPGMRQGTTETGIAVVAARPPAPDGAADAPGDDAERDPERVELALVDDPIGEPDGDPTEAASEDPPAGGDGVPGDAREPADAVADGVADASRPDRFGGDAAGAARRRLESPRGRLTVFSARYRLTLKGPERGRWEVDVVEEADAPLLTIEMVVRGVQRRSGEGADPERLDAGRLHELLAPAGKP